MTNVYAYHYNCWLTNNSFLGYIGYQSHSYIQGQRVVFEWVQGFVLLLTCLDEFKCSRKDPAPPPPNCINNIKRWKGHILRKKLHSFIVFYFFITNCIEKQKHASDVLKRSLVVFFLFSTDNFFFKR